LKEKENKMEANKMTYNKKILKGKIILEGVIELLSPAIIGSGRDENSDIDVLKDSEGKVYIPATSFAGVLRHTIKLDDSYKGKLEHFWGTSKEEQNHQRLRQSSVRIDDLLPNNNSDNNAGKNSDKNSKVVIRDGVKIDNTRGIAKEGAKFDYEVIEPGARFNLHIEVTLDGIEDDFKKSMLVTIINLLKEGDIRIGAKTNSGFGKIHLVDEKICIFDFSKKEDVLRWLKQNFTTVSKLKVENSEFDKFKIIPKTFTISADFVIKNSLIVRSYIFDPDKPDIENIKSNGKPVLPGTSIKGAIRARAERIVKTLGKPESVISDLFGEVDEKKKLAKKGRITVEETVIDGYPEEVQTRIKIDRFTGGTIESALLETKPLFSKKDGKVINLKITIRDYKDHEAGLMLLVLKDLWTGDLPIGGEKAVGRGVLEGRKAVIKYDENKKEIEFERISDLKEGERNSLQNFVGALVNLKLEGGKDVRNEING
jgi:CRISPR/Cas system CSM-associated protein Csm3 (group 7 of RAMP superfamily)